MAGNGADGNNAPPRMPLPLVRYQPMIGGPALHWSPASKTNPCSCLRDYAYPNHVVLAVDKERKTLARTVQRANAEIETLRTENQLLRARVRELEEMANQFLRLSNTVRDCTAGIMTDCETMIEEMLEIYTEDQGGERSSIGEIVPGDVEGDDSRGDREASPTYSPESDPSEDPDFPMSP